MAVSSVALPVSGPEATGPPEINGPRAELLVFTFAGESGGGPIAAVVRSGGCGRGGGAGLDFGSAPWLSEGVGVICLRVCVGLQEPA